MYAVIEYFASTFTSRLTGPKVSGFMKSVHTGEVHHINYKHVSLMSNNKKGYKMPFALISKSTVLSFKTEQTPFCEMFWIKVCLCYIY